MTDDEWEEHRNRAISTAFLTGRPTCADTNGVLRYADGDQEAISVDVDVAPPRESRSIYTGAMRASRFAFVSSILIAAGDVVVGFWRPWHFGCAALMLCGALLWRHVHRKQRALYGKMSARDPIRSS